MITRWREVWLPLRWWGVHRLLRDIVVAAMRTTMAMMVSMTVVAAIAVSRTGPVTVLILNDDDLFVSGNDVPGV